MRLTALVLSRVPGKEPVPFKPVGPLKLKDKITSKGDKYGSLVCVQEMQSLLACWKKFEYNEVMCKQPLEVFEKCHKHYLKELEAHRNRPKDSVLGHRSGRRLSMEQANLLLKQYPNPR